MEFKEYLSATAVQLKEATGLCGALLVGAQAFRRLVAVLVRSVIQPRSFIGVSKKLVQQETPALPRLDFKSDLNCGVEHLWIGSYVSYDVTNVSSLGNDIAAVRWIILARVELDCTQNLS
jgi:hypothetical protein